jgi:hypothetical protein
MEFHQRAMNDKTQSKFVYNVFVVLDNLLLVLSLFLYGEALSLE